MKSKKNISSKPLQTDLSDILPENNLTDNISKDIIPIPEFAKSKPTDIEYSLVNNDFTLINELDWSTHENYQAIINSLDSHKSAIEEFLAELKYYERDVLKQIEINERLLFNQKIIGFFSSDEEVGMKCSLDNCNISLIKIRKLIKLYETKIEENTKPASIHFTENANSKPTPVSSKKIQWLKEDTLILYLFESLYKEGCISASDYDSSVDFIINNFLNQKGKPFKRKNLSQSGNNLLSNKNKEPRNAHKIKSIFDK